MPDVSSRTGEFKATTCLKICFFWEETGDFSIYVPQVKRKRIDAIILSLDECLVLLLGYISCYMEELINGALCWQWLRLLLSPKKKFKTGDERQAYGIKHAEPLLHFALCFGSHSDPAVLYIPFYPFSYSDTYSGVSIPFLFRTIFDSPLS